MADTLRRAGGEAEIAWSEDAPHAWPLFYGWLPESDDAVRRAGAAIRRWTQGAQPSR
jgi:monoterpene epsilon-lactone hydrolase